MRCWCSKDLIHSGDHDYEDYGVEGEGIVSNLTCANNDCEVDIVIAYRDLGKEENDK